MNQYFEQMILAASPAELITLLYQRAIACVADAREHLRAGNIGARADAITRAYAIVAELLRSVDEEKAPALALNLKRLYCYMQERLLEANLRQSDGPLEETGRLLRTLADGWQEASASMSLPGGTGQDRVQPWVAGYGASDTAPTEFAQTEHAHTEFAHTEFAHTEFAHTDAARHGDVGRSVVFA